MSRNQSNFLFPGIFKVKQKDQKIQFHLPFPLPHRVRNLFYKEYGNNGFKIIQYNRLDYAIFGGNNYYRVEALKFILQNTYSYGKPLLNIEEQESEDQKDDVDSNDDDDDIDFNIGSKNKSETSDDDENQTTDDYDMNSPDESEPILNFNSKNIKNEDNEKKKEDLNDINKDEVLRIKSQHKNIVKQIKRRVRPPKKSKEEIEREEKEREEKEREEKEREEKERKEKEREEKERKEKEEKERMIIDDIYMKLSKYQNRELKHVDKIIYDDLTIISDILNQVSALKLKVDIGSSLFISICKIFTHNDLLSCTNLNRLASIFSIFFDIQKDDFKLRKIFEDSILQIVSGNLKINDCYPIISFFRSLINVSAFNAEMLNKEILLIETISSKDPSVKKEVDELKNFIELKKQTEIDSSEYSVIPKPNDLFFKSSIFDVEKIQNNPNKKWSSFKEYKRGMIDLTKLNFYYPFRVNLFKLRKDELDARDLFLYQNVQINFSQDTRYFELFKECNLFLKFEIRTPTNSKTINRPDWKRSERLSNRSLLILSTDPYLNKFDAVCKSCAIARGDDNTSQQSIRLLNQGIVPVSLVSGSISPKKTYFMFEPTSSWSAVQPVLQRLVKMNEYTFPKKFLNIITMSDFSENDELENLIVPTGLLLINQNLSLNEYVTKNWVFDRLSDDLKDAHLRVDHEQYKALRYCLTHNLTLVNGAPGTGKTHLAREILRILSQANNIGPVAVISYTNHALDSILEDVIKFIDPQQIIRWGGPMRSENQTLIGRKWMNCYLHKGIRIQRDRLATKRQQLKNLYNLRQMIFITTKNIADDPLNVQNYQIVFEYLSNFIKDIKYLFMDRYRLPFKEYEIEEYNECLRSNKKYIHRINLPDFSDYVRCWLLGNEYIEKRNEKYIDAYTHNCKIVFGKKYKNRFFALSEAFDNESNEEKIPRKIEQGNKNIILSEARKVKNITLDIDKKMGDEEEYSSEDEAFGDEDMIEMGICSYLNTKIGEEMPLNYVQYIRSKLNLLFENRNPSIAMINFLKDILAPLKNMIKDYESQLQTEENDFMEDETKSAGLYLRQMKLIGMTSTVASCRKEALEIAGCRIVIVEEAGELTESMLTCILPRYLKRLILIGDYQQLRPKVEYELTFEPFSYDISLFEKLVTNAKKQKAECLFTLSIQRRMHPEISQLVRSSFYTDGIENIIDDKTTYSLGIPKGIPHRVRFIMHDYQIGPSSGRSYSNPKEAEMCAALIPFFLCRGYNPKDITIIALYKGQKYEIERQIDILFNNKNEKIDSMNVFDSLKGARSPKDFKVVILDNFQGEENKVIIVSLTRSEKPGFIKNRNRSLVTLSRAREMLVVLGNKTIFGKENKKNELWKNISEKASQLGPYSLSTDDCPGMCVNKCKIHQNKNRKMQEYLSTPEDIIKYRFKFCNEKCNYRLPCGHNCQLTCHCHSFPPHPNEHMYYICPFRCPKKCLLNHQCTGRCGFCSRGKCPNCQVIVHHVFPCGHEADLKCYLVTSGAAKCNARCGKRLRCGHSCALACGHSGPCNCQVELTTICPNCKKPVNYRCGNRPMCMNRCTYELPCGHTCSNRCYQCLNAGHHNLTCFEKCSFVFPCGHHCDKLCRDRFPSHQHLICDKTIDVPNDNGMLTKHQCSMPIKLYMNKTHRCDSCGKILTSHSIKSCLNRCRCQCRKVCRKCGKRCRALTGEKCAFFCPHFDDLADVVEPPEEDGLVFKFHGSHFLLLDDAIEKVTAMYNSMMLAQSDVPISIHRLTCPVNGCTCNEPCLLGSWIFEFFNNKIENYISDIRNTSSQLLLSRNIRKQIIGYEPIKWIACKKCNEITAVNCKDGDHFSFRCSECNFLNKY